jgi:hypothetical protein
LLLLLAVVEGIESMDKFKLSLLLLSLLFVTSACQEAQFSAGAGKANKRTPTTPEEKTPETETPETETPTTEDPEVCPDTHVPVGAHLAFLIDNSNSNAATDCENPKQVDTFKNTGVYECSGETNREKAVKSAYDLMKAIADKAGNADAVSEVSIVSFPTRKDYQNGWQPDSDGWIEASGDNKTKVADAMLFSRTPFGLTPYGAAFTAGEELFAGINDAKAKVAVLVTDGEPTDKDPEAVAAKAKALRDSGVEVITVFVNSGETRTERKSKHTAMMTDINKGSNKAGEGNWFSDAYADLATYMESLLGGGDKKSLAERVADGQVVEVANSQGLTDVFNKIVKTKAIKCEPLL